LGVDHTLMRRKIKNCTTNADIYLWGKLLPAWMRTNGNNKAVAEMRQFFLTSILYKILYNKTKMVQYNGLNIID